MDFFFKIEGEEFQRDFSFKFEGDFNFLVNFFFGPIHFSRDFEYKIEGEVRLKGFLLYCGIF